MSHPTQESRRTLIVGIAPESRAPSVARLAWMLADTRRRTLETLSEVQAGWVDWQPPTGESLGTVLYHLAVIEADWLYVEILEAPLPPALERWFPHPVRVASGHLQPVTGESLHEHLARLAAVRAALLDTLAAMDETDLRRVRALPEYDVTPEWVLHHLMQHEAEHRGQIGQLLTGARAAEGSQP